MKAGDVQQLQARVEKLEEIVILLCRGNDHQAWASGAWPYINRYRPDLR